MIPFEISIVDAVGYVAAAVVFLTFCMRTMLSLRLIAIASNVAFIAYALIADLTPILLLHGALLPLNVLRLIQMQRLVQLANEAMRKRTGEERFDQLIPLGTRRSVAPGSTLFRKGDPARSLFIVIDGELLLPEIGVTLGRGAMVGEISLFANDGRRTASAVAVGPLTLSEITEQRVRELYFDNPGFAYSLIRLITRRLIENLRPQEDDEDVTTATARDPARS